MKYKTDRVVLDVLLAYREGVEEFECTAASIVQPPRQRYRPGIVHEGKDRVMLNEVMTPN